MIKSYFKHIRREIISEIKLAATEINVAVCWFTSPELFDVLCKKLTKGVSVNLIILNDSINNGADGLDFQRFIELGGRFYFGNPKKPMHNKYCIIDGTVLINGSYNWTYYAEKRNKENITIIREENTVKAFQADFHRLIEKFKPIKKVAHYAITNSQPTTIVENARIATETDLIIKSKKVFDGNELKLKHSLGESIYQDKFYTFIPKGSKIPIERIYDLTTIKDDQIVCSKDIRYGESSVGSENQPIGRFLVEGIPPMKKGKPGIVTKFSVDAYGLLTVTAKIRETGKETIYKYNIEHLIS